MISGTNLPHSPQATMSKESYSPPENNESSNVCETIYSNAVQDEIKLKKELSDFEQIMAQSGSVGLQTDTMAELESTLNIASEIAVFRSNRYLCA